MDSVTTEVLGSVTIDGPGSVMIASCVKVTIVICVQGTSAVNICLRSLYLFSTYFDRPGDLMICNSGDSGRWSG